MSYDLLPVNKKVKAFEFGAFTWPIFLQETGMGYVLGYGSGRCGGSYVYQQGQDASPSSNDGYKVTSFEAKAMAAVARGFVSVQRFVNKEWAELSPEARAQAEKTNSEGKPIYRGEWAENHLKRLELFADFAENSKGFRIH